MKWSLLVDLHDPYGAPKRVYINTPWFHFGFALHPKARYAGKIKEPWLSQLNAIPPGSQPYLILQRQDVIRNAEFEPSRWFDIHRR